MRRFLAYLPVLGLLTMLLAGCDPEAKADAADSTVEGSSTDTSSEGTESASGEVATGSPSAAIKLAPESGDDVAVISTDQGDIVVMLHPERAPKHVANFLNLAKSGFYDGTRFHRVMDGFMIQGGDPNSKNLNASGTWGRGGNIVNGREVNVPAEFNNTNHARGILSMARSPAGPDTASSQFYIVHSDSSFLNGQYTAFGMVVSGLDVVDKVVRVTKVTDGNGTVVPNSAVVVNSIKVATWPLD